MTTPRARSLVSLATALTIALAVGGCAISSRNAADPSVSLDQPAVFRFDNDARDYVRVYLVGMRREWMLGRVEPGARATLRIPQDALGEDQGPMRLAVLVGERMVLRAAIEPRAETTLTQSVTALLTQRWTFSPLFSRGQRLTAIPVGRAPADVAHE